MMRTCSILLVASFFLCRAASATVAPDAGVIAHGTPDESLQSILGLSAPPPEEHGEDRRFLTGPVFGPNPGTDAMEGTLLAHAILVKSMPQKEQMINAAPERIELWFNEGVGSKYTSLAVVNSEGKRVDKKDGALDFSDRSHLSATLESLPPGRYGVRYRVQSADGHIVTGKYFFTVGEQ
jgi:copper resistance protein C